MKATATVPVLHWVRIPRPPLLIAICVAIAVGGIVVDPARGWSAWLIAAVFGICLALGGSLFAAINVAGGAKWWNPIRKNCMTLGGMLPVPAAVLLITVVAGLSVLYPWARHDVIEHNHIVHAKIGWLNMPFFLARAIIVLASWFGMAAFLRGRLTRHIEAPDATSHSQLYRSAVIFILLFAVTISVGFWDWTMSLEPEWFSTMYGVYVFAGILQGGIAAVIVMLLMPVMRQRYAGVAESLVHDLAKLLFAFSFFWAYIWFCQYLLIWYANVPEEVIHFTARTSNGWTMIFLLNVFLNFAVPFLVLMSQRVKKQPSIVLQVALIVLAGRWVDTYLLVAPSNQLGPSVPVFAIAATIAVVVGMVVVAKRMADKSAA